MLVLNTTAGRFILKIELIDVHAAFGGGIKPAMAPIKAKELLEEMRCLGIARAIVRTFLPPDGGDVIVANRQLFRDCARSKRLIPCPLIIPAGGGELPPEEEQTDRFIRQGARMVWMRPASERFNLTETVTGKMFNALVERRLPVLCLKDLISLADMDMLLRRHRGLRIVAANVGYGELRVVLPMLQAHPDFYMATGKSALDHDFLTTVAHSGVIHKIFFGSGFPEAEPMMAVTQLMYADIPENNKRAVGHENILRLLGEVRQ